MGQAVQWTDGTGLQRPVRCCCRDYKQADHDFLLCAAPSPLQLQLDIENLRAALDEERDAASKADSTPGRARQAADAAVAALRALREEEAEVTAQLRNWEAAETVAAQVGSNRACLSVAQHT